MASVSSSSSGRTLPTESSKSSVAGGLAAANPGSAVTSRSAFAASVGARLVAKGSSCRIESLVALGLKPHVERTFPLDEAARAHELGEQGRTRGKIVLIV